MFLDYKRFLVDAGTTPTVFQAEIRTHLTTAGWQVAQEAVGFLDLLPPVTETVGNAAGKTIARLSFTSTTISVGSYLTSTANIKSVYTLFPSTTTGSYILTVGGEDITTPITAPQYPQQSNAKSDQVFAYLTQFQIDNPTSKLNGFVVTQYTDESGNKIILLTSKVGYVAVTGGGVTETAAGYTANSVPFSIKVVAASATVDYAVGFVYYLGMYSRTILLGTRTTVSFGGPLFAGWGDNAQTVSQTPKGLVPAELIVGSLETAGSTQYYTHATGYVDKHPNVYYVRNALTGTLEASDYAKLRNVYATTSLYNTYAGVILNNGGFVGLDALLEDSLPDMSVLVAPGGAGSQDSGAAFIRPSLVLKDLYGFLKTATNESTHLARVLDKGFQVTTQLENGGVAVLVDSTAEFPVTGTFILGDEVISYTGKTGTSFAGLTRGKYGTTAAVQAVATVGYLAQWFVKLNGAAILTGDTRA